MMRHGMSGQDQAKQEHYDGPLVMARRFKGLAEAMVAKSILDSAEIDSFLTDEKVIGMVYPNLIGMIKLMVRPEDLDAAVELLGPEQTEV